MFASRIDIPTTVIYRYYRNKKLSRKQQKKFVFYGLMKRALSIKKLEQGVWMDVKYVYKRERRRYQFSTFDSFTI